ncbi:hypothetical protein RUM43_007161 [Polyplax serrata]|uniref:Phospholipid/glycerol acyltransferase domain-containing protein n=1 Tax=Polyplax serrata TaxID=468196 RepID=A0AAN8PC74_POLSC
MAASNGVQRDLNEFSDILKDRRGTSDIVWASRKWEPTVAHKQTVTLNGKEIKSIVLHSLYLKDMINKIHDRFHVPVDELYKKAEYILEEIGFYRKPAVIRWFGVFISKILKKLYSGVFVNEEKLLQIKSEMGKNPVIFIPSHKSYCDFVLMAYICFHYDIDIPRIAAGTDFQSMAIIGNLLRDACAFFIRRSFNNDELYSTVFTQYVQTLVTDGNGPVEFFIEGTRSRTSKSMFPKFGFLTMALKPFFFGLVPDISIVPVNLSYDKILEELLFAYELLGVPKPKESTKGFLKALSILNENCGSVYAKFGEPISIKEYFGDTIDRSIHVLGPVHLQELSTTENKQIINLAHEIIRRQKKLTTLNYFNMIALILNNNIISCKEALSINDLLLEVNWISSILMPEHSVNSITKDILLHHLSLHKPLIFVTEGNKINLGKFVPLTQDMDSTQLKGHKLAYNTLNVAIPMIMLQNYSNPAAYLICSLSFLTVIINSCPNDCTLSKDWLYEEFQFLCSIFSFEFVFHKDNMEKDFSTAFAQGCSLGILNVSSDTVRKGDNKKLQLFCINFLSPFITGYITLTEILLLTSNGGCLSDLELLQACQAKIESRMNDGRMIHPNNLSLDVLKNALQSFTAMGAVSKVHGTPVKLVAIENAVRNINSKLQNFDGLFSMNHNISEQFSNFTRSSL